MPTRYPERASVGQYKPLHLSALSLPVNTTSSTTITAGSGVIVTPAAMTNIFAGTQLRFSGGTGTAETVVVTAVTSTTFTATFANNHSGAYTIVTPTALTYIPAGRCVSTSSATSITAGSNVTVTPAQITNIYVGQKLNIANGTGTAEDIRVKRVDPTLGTFTADFANNHSGLYTITSYLGTNVGPLVVNQTGTSITITLYNGSPNLVPLPPDQGAIAVINTSDVSPFSYACTCDYGLFYTVTGTTAGDYTLHYLDMEA
jgi:hypothetical protein